MTPVLRAALAIGLAIDLFVGVLSLFAQQWIEPLLDLTVRDPAMTLFAGGEFVVAAGIYGLALADPKRHAALFWLCALDQTFAIALPLVAIGHGQLAVTPKTIGPMPLQALLIAIYCRGALRPS